MSVDAVGCHKYFVILANVVQVFYMIIRVNEIIVLLKSGLIQDFLLKEEFTK